MSEVALYSVSPQGGGPGLLHLLHRASGDTSPWATLGHLASRAVSQLQVSCDCFAFRVIFQAQGNSEL